MCLNCGCGLPTVGHDDKRNITLDDLSQAARAQNMSLGQTIFNIVKTLPKVVMQMPESADKSAIKLTMSLMVNSKNEQPTTTEDPIEHAADPFQEVRLHVQEPANMLGPLDPDTNTATDVTNVTDNPAI